MGPARDCKLRASMTGCRPGLPVFREKTSAANRQPKPNLALPVSFPPFTRQLSTLRTAKMLFSVSRASVRRIPDGPGDGRPALCVAWCCPVLQQSGFSLFRAGPLTPASANTEPPGRRRSLPTCWPQLRSDEDIPQPHGLAKRYVESSTLFLSPRRHHTCSHPSPGAAGRWIGVEELLERAGLWR